MEAFVKGVIAFLPGLPTLPAGASNHMWKVFRLEVRGPGSTPRRWCSSRLQRDNQRQG